MKLLKLTVFLVCTTSATSIAHAGEIRGVVADSSQTTQLQAVDIIVEDLGRTATTDRNGAYVIADIPAGSYQISASYIGAATVTQTVSVPETGTVTANFILGAGADNQILVIGQAANLASSLSRQRAADGVSSVLTRDAIGQFPDQNVAESIRRLPGVNVLNDQGEGRFVSIRGLDPELNSSSINGVRLPAPESDVRSVALDVISSDIIESIEIKKSLTPDMDGDSIGGSIEINTTSAFDRTNDLLTAKLEGSYNEYADSVTPKGSIDFATRIGEDFGISGGISYYRREFESDNIEAADWNEAGGIVFAEEVQYRDYDVTRERLSASLNFDVRASAYTTLFARGQFSQFDDQEYRRRTTIILNEDPASGTDTSAFFTDADGRIEVRRDIKDRFERQRIRSFQIGGDHDDGIWEGGFSASYAKSSELENFSVDPTRFRSRFDGDGVDVNFDYSDPRLPLYSVTSGSALFNDPSEYSFNRVELTDLSASVDEEYALQGDLGRSFLAGSGEFTVQTGFKSRWRDKSYDFNGRFFGDYDGDYTLADVLGAQTYLITDMGPVASHTGATDFFLANLGNFEVDQYETDLLSFPSDYSVQEDVLAGYLLGRFDSSTLRVIAGVRAERTYNELNGNLVVDDGDDVTDVIPVFITRNYTDWLPSATVRFSPERELVFRLAGYKSLVRPKLSNLAPRYTINEDLEAEFGNPNLLPYRAWNADLSAEYYFSENGAVSIGAFYKTIDNFIVDSVISASGTFQGVDYDELTIPINGDSAEVFGIEASFSQTLSFLPAPFDGLLVQANYTFTDATGTLDDGREIALPAASRHTGNIVLGYENGPFEFRAAGTYRSRYLDEIGAAADQDRLVDNHFQLDLSARVRVTDDIRIFGEWINVNNAKYFAYQNFMGAQRNLQYEAYGSTFKFGARVSF
ncbi:TonB-dependent receptor [Alteraurantiacibacter aestuarii]|uniref:TonB-dependent receptor n=1 Tax=Alteraurantiacibacter aestuarii TaxID=650004 RepID=A0A844ZTD0_9SPHN|nr:TonB-dependent receptor [Alteraurantiacibacter aestuarii]MXO88829.1 TonB-dependent receptor [Alteraurantiacibacter aestuarii]